MGIDWLIGKTCIRVFRNYPQNFTFEFESESFLAVDCLWRIVYAGWLVRTSLDHEQQFGLPAPLDAFAEAASLLDGHRVNSIEKRNSRLDAGIRGRHFSRSLVDSSGYEPWNLTAPGIWVIGIGGVSDASGSCADAAYPPGLSF